MLATLNNCHAIFASNHKVVLYLAMTHSAMQTRVHNRWRNTTWTQNRIFYTSNNLITLQKVMNRELLKIKKWLDASQLALNTEKTKFVIFHSPQKKITEQIIIKFVKKKTERKTSVKFLGVLLDSSLRWKSHITELSKNSLENLFHLRS